MNTIVHTLPTILIFATSALFSQPLMKSSSPRDRLNTALSMLSLPPGNGGLGKTTSAPPESSLVTRIDTYGWDGSAWTTDRGYIVSYDPYGRPIGYRLDPPLTTPLYHTEETIVEYDDINNLIRKIEYSTDSSATKFEKSEGSTDYYLNTRKLPGITRPPFIALPHSQILPTSGAAFDSVKFFFSVWDRTMGAMGSADLYKYTFSYDDTAVRVVNWSRPAGSDTIRIDGQYRYHYRFNGSGRIDSIISSCENGAGTYEVTDLYRYAYSDERLSAITHITNKMLSTHHYDLAYTPQGRLSSYTEQYTSDVVVALTNTSWVVYTYSAIPVGAAAPSPHRGNNTGRVRAGLERNHLRLTVPAGAVIVKVTLFDLRGRRVRELRFPAGATGSGSVRFAVPANGAGVRIVRVTTDCGEYNLSVGSASTHP